MLESVRDVLILVRILFIRQLNVEPHAGACAFKCAFVHGLHDPRPTPGNHRKSGLGEPAGDVFGSVEVRMLRWDGRATEDRNGGVDGLEWLRGSDELCDNLEHSPPFARRAL